MKLFKRIFVVVLVLLAVVAVGGMVYLSVLKNAALPDYDENIQLEGIKDEVVVLRDSFAIAHVYAQNERDLYKAVGYLMAEDRLWQMDLLRRVTLGRLSEIMGKRMVRTDLLMRALRIQEKSEKLLQVIDPGVLIALQAFAEGVNDYIENNDLPPEFTVLGYEPEKWMPVHSINLIGYMAWDLSSGWTTEIMLHKLAAQVDSNYIQALIPDLENFNTVVYPDDAVRRPVVGRVLLTAAEELENLGVVVFNGSNNWAVSGRKSKTGKPVLANDMHLGLFAPGIWYQMHQVVDGKLNVTGLVLPGQPFVIAGHNDSIAWGMTNVMLDDLDFYAETLNEDSTRYLLDGQWRDLLVKNEIIKTKEGEDIHKVLRFTHRGPLVNEFKDEQTALSVRWLGNEPSNELRTVYLLNRAANWSDFRDAVKTFISISQNIVYADVQGNIGLQASAGIPIRKGSGIEIYPGDTSLYDWTGIVPFEELPYELNPERGYVSSANNKTVPSSYPHYISYWYAMPNRIDRIREMLEAVDKHDLESFSAIQTDVRSKKAEKFVPLFLEALQQKTDWNPMEKEALDALQNWNYEMDRNSNAATVFEVLYRVTAKNLIRDELSDELARSLMGERILIEHLMVNSLDSAKNEWVDDVSTTQRETFADMVQQSFSQMADSLSSQFGNSVYNWEWGKLHTLTMSHPLGVVEVLDKVFFLNRGPYGVPGSYHTVCPYSYSYNNLYNVNHGASHRHLFDLADWNRSKTVIPTGTSGIPSSAYYLDQLNLYLQNHYHDDPFSAEAVDKKALFRMKFIPE